MDTPEPTKLELMQVIGPCPDRIQRVKDLYKVNAAASWASRQLGVLADMARDQGLPTFFQNELLRIRDGIEAV